MSRLNLLVAEDDATTRLLLESTLKRRDYEVVAVENGREAWRILEHRHFPVVISDYLMPEMDGFELTRRIRAARPDNYTYVILLTSVRGKVNHLEAIDAGVDDFVPKPFDPDLLNARLRVAQRILGLQQHAAQLEGLLRICSSCKKIHDTGDTWTQLEGYISRHSELTFSHTYCPVCAAKWMGESA
jgi:two-component system, NtrC family, sensor kinase